MLIQSRRNVVHCNRTEKAATPFLCSVFPLIVMSNPTVVFDPYAAADLSDIVQTIVDNHNVAITGQVELPQKRVVFSQLLVYRDQRWNTGRLCMIHSSDSLFGKRVTLHKFLDQILVWA